MSVFTTISKPFQYVCKRSESVFAAIEKCLDNGVEACLVVGDDNRLIGQVTLTDIRRAILDGTAMEDMSLDRHISDVVSAPTSRDGMIRNDPEANNGPLAPVLDYGGRLIGVEVDRSRQFVQIAKPDLSHLEFRALLDAFVSSWISSKGTYIQRLERDFAAFCGTEHGVAVSNGTAAIHLALIALDIGPGDEVIVPDLTFVATINAVLHAGATPVIVDVDPLTWSMSARAVADAITPRTKAVIPVHLYGRPAEIGPIAELARTHGVYVIEDCAEAHGARYDGRPVGQFGDIGCFSFFANKVITTGEGGICVTKSETLAATLRVLRDHGMAINQSYWLDRVGYNYRMTNLQAAIGSVQLRRVHQTLRRNQRLELLYREYLNGIPDVTFPPPLPALYRPITWLVCVQVPPKARAELIKAARGADIEIRPFFPSLSALPIYEKYARPCPISSALSITGLNLPTSSAVDRHVVEKVAGVFHEVLG